MEIRYELKPAAQRRREPFRPQGPLSFGQLRTDHMFLMDHVDGAWRDPRIVPYGPFSLPPGAVVLHYSQEIFEGAKAFKHPDGEIYAFRIDKNAERLNRSAPGVCMPTIPVEDQVKASVAYFGGARRETSTDSAVIEGAMSAPARKATAPKTSGCHASACRKNGSAMRPAMSAYWRSTLARKVSSRSQRASTSASTAAWS